MSNLHTTISLFREAADAISSKYLSDIRLATAMKGERPPFEELITRLKKMEKELTGKGVQIIEESKKTLQGDTDELTGELREVIRSTIEHFVKQL